MNSDSSISPQVNRTEIRKYSRPRYSTTEKYIQRIRGLVGIKNSTPTPKVSDISRITDNTIDIRTLSALHVPVDNLNSMDRDSEDETLFDQDDRHNLPMLGTTSHHHLCRQTALDCEQYGCDTVPVVEDRPLSTIHEEGCRGQQCAIYNCQAIEEVTPKNTVAEAAITGTVSAPEISKNDYMYSCQTTRGHGGQPTYISTVYSKPREPVTVYSKKAFDRNLDEINTKAKYHVESHKNIPRKQRAPHPFLYVNDDMNAKHDGEHGNYFANGGSEDVLDIHTHTARRIKRAFCPSSPLIWLQAMDSAFLTHGISSPSIQFQVALENIDTKHLTALQGYLKTPDWNNLKQGIRQIYGTKSHSERLNNVQALVMTSSPRVLLNQILTEMSLPIDTSTPAEKSFIRHMFLIKLPLKLRITLQSLDESISLTDLCNTAERVYATMQEGEDKSKGLGSAINTTPANTRLDELNVKLAKAMTNLQRLTEMQVDFVKNCNTKQNKTKQENLNYINCDSIDNSIEHDDTQFLGFMHANRTYTPPYGQRNAYGNNQYRQQYSDERFQYRNANNWRPQNYANQGRNYSQQANQMRQQNYRPQQQQRPMHPSQAPKYNMKPLWCEAHTRFGDNTWHDKCSGRNLNCNYELTKHLAFL